MTSLGMRVDEDRYAQTVGEQGRHHRHATASANEEHAVRIRAIVQPNVYATRTT